CAIVDCRIRFRIKNWWLQNSGRKNNITQAAVVSVVGLRRHAPIGAIDWPRKAPRVEIPIQVRASFNVADQIVSTDDKLGVIARMIGVTDFDRVSIKFLERFFFRLGPHPVELLDPGPIRILQVGNERLNFLLRLRRKIFRGVKLTNAEPHRAERPEMIADQKIATTYCRDGALPTRLLFFLTG